MNPDDELVVAEANELTAALATAKALVSLLELIRPIVDWRAKEDTRFAILAQQVRLGLTPGGGTPVTLRALLEELGGK